MQQGVDTPGALLSLRALKNREAVYHKAFMVFAFKAKQFDKLKLTSFLFCRSGQNTRDE